MNINLFELKKKIFFRFVVGLIFIGMLLFLPAGSLYYWEAWVYISIFFIPTFFLILYFLKNDPKLLERRMRMKEKEETQKTIIKIANIFFIIGFLVAGFDKRYEWSDVTMSFVIFSDVMISFAYLLLFLVFKENTYASRIIEVEKGQKVITTGPYAIVRHPMYLAIIIMFFFTPLALGSFWALIFFFPLMILIVLRLLDEEKVLLKELSGYKEYCQKTRYHLFPFIW